LQNISTLENKYCKGKAGTEAMFSGSGGFDVKKAVMSRKERGEHADEWRLTTLWPKPVIDEIWSTKSLSR
jgi:hypothetical protein